MAGRAAVSAAGGWIAVCGSSDLVDGGDGVRFDLPIAGGAPLAAFVVRADGMARAYLNRCAHVAVELDWLPGRFLDETGRFIVCATHGALYHADSGACAGGPCRGAGLVRLVAREAHGQVEVAVPAAPSHPIP